jgi:5-methylthioadenosine/S-adenosylhomocysteine deaminase
MPLDPSVVATAVTNVTLLTLDRARRIIPDGCLIIHGDRIGALGTRAELLEELAACQHQIDGDGCVALPGFVNCHTHTFQSLLRGLATGLDLIQFLSKLIYPVTKVITPESTRAGAAISILEAVKSGTTCLVDNHSGDTSWEATQTIAQEMDKLGIRGMVARGIRVRTPRATMWGVPDHVFSFDLSEELEITERLATEWEAVEAARIRICPAPLTLFLAGEEDLLAAKALADRHQVPLHIHVAETQSEVDATLEDHGLREVEYLEALGILDEHCHIVHGVWLSDHELDLTGERHAQVVHNPTSNMALGSGVARIPEMLERGINVALGTDGVGNFNHDMFNVIRSAPLLQAVHNRKPNILSAEQVLEMATRGGASALGMEGEIGSLEIGKKADVILLDLDRPHLAPYHNLVDAIVFGATAAEVKWVFIDGRVVVSQGDFTAGDEAQIMAEAQSAAQDLIGRAGIRTPIERVPSSW